MEKTDCLLEVHRNVIDVKSIVFLMILLAPEVSFVTLHMRWHKGCCSNNRGAFCLRMHQIWVSMSIAAGARLHKARHSSRTKTKLFAMALQTKLFFLLQVCVIIFIVTESVERSKHGCIMCGKKSQRTPFRCVKLNTDLEACFGFLEKTSGDICEACRKALQQYRKNGKTFHHVSVFLTIFCNRTYTRNVKINIERCCMQLKLQSVIISSSKI